MKASPKFTSLILTLSSLLITPTTPTPPQEEKERNTNIQSSFPKLSKTYDNAIPLALQSPLLNEVKHYTSLPNIHQSGSMKFGKKTTNWFNLNSTARNYIEFAIKGLFDFADVDNFYDINNTVKHYNKPHNYSKANIIGAEWWIQALSSSKGLGLTFHYDKDESHASNHMVMKYPILSTVTYLTDTGAPTLILNQTSLDGNVEYPAIPYSGVLVYPKRGRHTVFRGDLNHGVSKSLSLSNNKEIEVRYTLLVNWWGYKPAEPNCKIVSDEVAIRNNLYYPDEIVEESVITKFDGSLVKDAELLNMSSSNTSLHVEKMQPSDLFYYSMPRSNTLQPQSVNYLKWSHGSSFKDTSMLNLNEPNIVKALFNNPLPKCIVFVNSMSTEIDDSGMNEWLQLLAKNYSDRVKVYFGVYEEVIDALNMFGLKRNDLPKAVWHDTVNDIKRFMSGAINESNLQVFWEDGLMGVGREEL